MQLRPLAILGIEGGLAGEDVGLGGIDPLGALEDLPEGVEAEVDDDADVVGEEAGDVPVAVDEDVEAVEDDDEGEEDEGDPAEVGLEMRLEDERVAVDALRLERLVELDVRHADGRPGEERGDRRQVLEPLEGGRGAAAAEGEVGQPADGGGDADAPVRDAELRAPQEEARGLSVLGEGVEVARAGVEEGVGGRRGGGQDDGVDDGGEDLDACTADGNDPWGGRGVALGVWVGAKKVRVVVWNEDADGEGAENIEEEDSPEHSADSLGDVLPWVLSLASGNGDHLHATIRESGVDERGPKTEESACVASGVVRLHRTGVLPVPESDAVVVRVATEIDDEGHEE